MAGSFGDGGYDESYRWQQDLATLLVTVAEYKGSRLTVGHILRNYHISGPDLSKRLAFLFKDGLLQAGPVLSIQVTDEGREFAASWPGHAQLERRTSPAAPKDRTALKLGGAVVAAALAVKAVRRGR